MRELFLPTAGNNYFPKILTPRILIFVFLVLFFLKILTIPTFISLVKSPLFADLSKNTLYSLLNNARIKNGLAPLKENSKLVQSATMKAEDILKKDYFSHWSPDGISPWYWFKSAGYDFLIAGENLGIGFLDSEEIFNAWMNSRTHRQNILDPRFKEVGIAILKGEFQGKDIYVVVQHFGVPKMVKSQIKGTEKVPPPTTSSISEEKIEKAIAPAVSSNKNIHSRIYSLVRSKYILVLNLVGYGVISFILLLLSITIYFDIFRFKKYHLDYKFLLPSWAIFFFLMMIFLVVDFQHLLSFIPHKLIIYGLPIR